MRITDEMLLTALERRIGQGKDKKVQLAFNPHHNEYEFHSAKPREFHSGASLREVLDKVRMESAKRTIATSTRAVQREVSEVTPKDIFDAAVAIRERGHSVSMRKVQQELHAVPALVDYLTKHHTPHRRAYDAGKFDRPFSDVLER